MNGENPERKRTGYARGLARKVLAKCKHTGVPIDVYEVATANGFQVKELDKPDGFSAVLIPQPRAIGVNKNHHRHRRRFSIAHELGHHFLRHPPEHAMGELYDEKAAKKCYDSEADEFAAELLVPMRLLRGVYKQQRDMEALAEMFDVSKEVVSIQIMKHCLGGRSR